MNEQFFFELKRPITLPSSTIAGAYIVFPTATCVLSYETVPNPKQSAMEVTLTINNKTTKRKLFEVAKFNVTKEGFPTGVILNQEEIDTWNTQYDSLNTELTILVGELADLQSQKDALEIAGEKVLQTLLDDINTKAIAIKAKEQEITALYPRPEVNEVYYNKYDDVIQYFDNKGAVTTDGVTWAKAILLLYKQPQVFLIQYWIL